MSRKYFSRKCTDSSHHENCFMHGWVNGVKSYVRHERAYNDEQQDVFRSHQDRLLAAGFYYPVMYRVHIGDVGEIEETLWTALVDFTGVGVGVKLSVKNGKVEEI